MRWVIVALMLVGVTKAGAAEMPAGFVWLKDVDPTIEQEIRYYGDHNFLGRPVAGYEAPECILTREAAEVLREVQRELEGSELSLKVYDCYRPQRAVDDFVAWSKDVADQAMKAEFYPRVDKARVFELGYIAEKSGHTRGSTIDLTIVTAGQTVQRAFVPGEPLVDCVLPASQRFPDTSIDFGTGFDCMDEKSHQGRADIPVAAQTNRAMFTDIMVRHGFVPYSEEWWHYTLKAEPHPDTYFDFPVTPRPAAAKGN